MSSDKETKGIKVMMILEVIGKPPEHLKETLEKMSKDIGEEKGVKIENKKINEPTELKNQEGFYTSFAEIEVEIEEIPTLLGLIFKYMPAHIEIIYPESITLTNNGLGDVLSELTRRLHGYDELARMMQMEKSILQKKLKELMGDSNEKTEEKK